MEILNCPIKSPTDDNIYRLVKLPNDFQALLITEHIVKPKNDNWVGDENCVDLEIKKFNEKFIKSTENKCPCTCKKSSRNEQEEKVKKNKAKLNKPKKATTKCPFDHGGLAAVALCIGVGSFSDPDELPGLAHLCEHILFLGSRKYPKRDAWDIFITENGGESNAVTEGECTVFTFTVNKEKLEEALDMLVQFFIDPLMKLADVDVERDIVESEFVNIKTDLANEDERRRRILQLTADRTHPVARFCRGNKQSLTSADGNDKTVHKHLTEFKNKYYGAEHMMMVIQSGHHIDVLAKMVNKVCGQIPKSGVPRPDFSNYQLPYNTDKFRKLYKVIPATDQNLMFITWELPAKASKNYLTKPIDYIARIIGNEACGGLAYSLRRRLWITQIDVSAGTHFLEQNDYCSLFRIQYFLTEAGLENYEQVLRITFAYLKLTLTIQPSTWYFEEFQDLSAVEFHTVNFGPALNNVSSLIKQMRISEPQHIVLAETLVTQYDPDLIMKYLKMLTSDSANYMLFSKSFKLCHRMDKYYGIRYRVESFNEDFFRQLKRIACVDRLSLEAPCPNPFIAFNFCKVKETVENPNDHNKADYPVCVYNKNRVEFWNKYNWDSQSIAEATYRISLCTSIHHNRPEITVLLDLWIQVLLGNSISFEQCGHEAGMNLKVERSLFGVDIQISGLVHKLGLFVHQVFDRIFHLYEETSEIIYQLNKSIQQRKYYEELKSQETLVLRFKDYLTTTMSSWIPSDLYEVLKPITFVRFRQFCEEFSHAIHIVGFAEGNVSQAGTAELAKNLMKKFKLSYSDIVQFPDPGAAIIPYGDTICRMRSFNMQDHTAAILNVYSIGIPTMKQLCIIQILSDMMSEPAFQYLRNEENLGYIVEVNWEYNGAAVEFYITVKTDIFKGSHVKAKIDNFVKKFYDEAIKDLNKPKFEKMKEVRGWNSPDFFYCNNWREILTGELMFESSKLQLNELRKLRAKSVRCFFKKFFLPKSVCKKSKMRKLSVQVVSSADKEYLHKTVQCIDDKIQPPKCCFSSFVPFEKKYIRQWNPEYKFIALTPRKSQPQKCEGRQKYIRNFSDFRKSLYLYPRKGYPGSKS